MSETSWQIPCLCIHMDEQMKQSKCIRKIKLPFIYKHCNIESQPFILTNTGVFCDH